ncbi:DeoR/GlpR family DNA-binding transcription regulator [Rubellimicrobium arenae]|uniref:DeoR/GlpR family DNA-binding transcription regulator n=1 Tax=Rubellimicrobium arenae TaxID=2817372 RepID=UPI001B306132|nr:DeoR/GlpR family DNA-binding transcription regulator [Rubellimicrobium arenae]
MSQSLRQPEIVDLARRDGKVTVEDLAQHFGVTLQTIRRDLAELAETGRLERVHGGAVYPSSTTNIDYEERRRLQAGAKAAMARACAEMIPNDASVFLAIGTSTEAVAHELVHHRNLLVVTNNLNVANILQASPDCRVVVAGGALRHADGGMVGALTAQTIRQFRFDVGVIGCSALDEGGDLLDYDLEEVGVSRAVLDQARRSILVADHSKFQRHAPARIASLAEIDCVVTDRAFPEALAGLCRDWQTTVIVAAHPACAG